jgi:Gamma-glutamyl cyclotransferase, AIG2-like
MRFFFYGTLLDRDVMALVLGRRLPPAAYAAAVLRGHARRRAKGASYPTLMRDPQRMCPVRSWAASARATSHGCRPSRGLVTGSCPCRS